MLDDRGRYRSSLFGIDLGGGPIRRRSRDRMVARWGRPNIAIDEEQGVWWDHARDVSGGVLDLVRTVRDCSKGDAVQWLCTEGFIQDHNASPAERRRAAARRAALDAAARDIAYWRRGRMAQLERSKAYAIGRNDEAVLAASASELYRLQTDGAAVVAAYRDHLSRDLQGARRLIEWAREDERDVHVITAAIVCMLAKVVERDHAVSMTWTPTSDARWNPATSH